MDHRGRSCVGTSGLQPALRRVLAVVALGIVASVHVGCGSKQVEVDFRRNFRFASVRTYAWLPDPPGHAGDPVLHNDLIDGRVRDAVDRELETMGYRRVGVDEADLHVTYYLGLETRVNMQMVARSYRYRGGGFFDSHNTQTAVRQYERGTLILDLLEAERRRLVWRGTVSSRVRRRSTPEERDEMVNDAVEKILQRFPPGGPQFRPANRS